VERIPLLAEEAWRDSLIEAGAPPRLRRFGGFAAFF